MLRLRRRQLLARQRRTAYGRRRPSRTEKLGHRYAARYVPDAPAPPFRDAAE